MSELSSIHYSRAALEGLGITIGENIFIDKSVRFFGASKITIGSNVRIDCFCILSAAKPLTIGNFVHIAAYTCLFGAAGIEVGDYAGLSSRVSIFSTSDDYSEGHLTNPVVPESLRKVNAQKVTIKSHCIIGCGSVVLPGVTLGKGVAVGALSLVNKNIPEFLIVSGMPVRKIGLRDRARLEQLEAEHRETIR